MCVRETSAAHTYTRIRVKDMHVSTSTHMRTQSGRLIRVCLPRGSCTCTRTHLVHTIQERTEEIKEKVEKERKKKMQKMQKNKKRKKARDRATCTPGGKCAHAPLRAYSYSYQRMSGRASELFLAAPLLRASNGTHSEHAIVSLCVQYYVRYVRVRVQALRA